MNLRMSYVSEFQSSNCCQTRINYTLQKYFGGGGMVYKGLCFSIHSSMVQKNEKKFQNYYFKRILVVRKLSQVKNRFFGQYTCAMFLDSTFWPAA